MLFDTVCALVLIALLGMTIIVLWLVTGASCDGALRACVT